MTPHQITLVHDSFAILAPERERAAALFYARLFELDPSLRPMFPRELDEQGRKLMQVLATVVRSLNRIDALLPTIDELALRHVRYGVVERHYATVGEALLWTLERGLGDAFCPVTKEAWSAAYGLLSGRMVQTAYCGAASAA